MMVLGIDPGPTRSGWALLDFTIPSSPVYFAAGLTESPLGLFRELDDAGHGDRLRLVAVEQSRGRVDPLRVAAVLLTVWTGGRFIGIAESRSLEAVALGVTEWRNALIGTPRRGDDIDENVAAFLRRFVRHWPARSNVHVRDAAGVACVAVRSWRKPACAQYGSPRRLEPDRSLRNPHADPLSIQNAHYEQSGPFEERGDLLESAGDIARDCPQKPTEQLGARQGRGESP